MSHYFDYNATAPLAEEVREALYTQENLPYNPSSVHYAGRHARKLVEEARRQLMEAVGADAKAYRVIFTASGTEANNHVFKGIEAEAVAVSAVEHISVLKAAAHAAILPVNDQGIIDLAALEAFLQNNEGKKTLVSIILANNETGVLQPMQEIAVLTKRYGALLHSDASQALGKIPLSLPELGVDVVTLSAHKCGGPLGAAALIMRRDIAITPLLIGGGQEQSYRAGTENVQAIFGFGVAAKSCEKRIAAYQKINQLREKMEAQMQQKIPSCVIFGQQASRLPNTTAVAIPGFDHQAQLIQLDLAGIAVSAGSACSSGKIETSHVLTAMGVDAALAGTAIRISLGPQHEQSDIDFLMQYWAERA